MTTSPSFPPTPRSCRKDVNLSTQLTRGIRLNLPIASAAMDTVTEARLAIAMAQLGGIGILHKNMSLQQQAAHVAQVKQFEAGVIRDPFTVSPDTTIGEVLKLTRARNISGVPVVEGGQLVGIVTSRDMRFETKLDDPVRHIMTKKDKLVTVREGASDEEVLQLMHKHRIEKVLVVDDELPPARPDHGQGHPEGARQPRTPPRTSPSACSPAPRSAWAATPRPGSRRWSRPAST